MPTHQLEPILIRPDQTPIDRQLTITIITTSSVIMKLLAFTLAMIVVPIGSYYASVDTLFKGTTVFFFSAISSLFTVYAHIITIGNTTYAGGLAAVMANVVLVGYVIVAMMEDQSDEDGEKPTESKKSR